jgi:NitT/TauT family transport system permease protein
LGLLHLPAGANIAAVLLMLLGTQWYLLFNVIAGASAIPQDLQYTSDLMWLHGWRRWRTLILPALFPYIVTGLITASGGAWNASIVRNTLSGRGGSRWIMRSSPSQRERDYALLLARRCHDLDVVTINRLVWRRLYHVAEERFRWRKCGYGCKPLLEI